MKKNLIALALAGAFVGGAQAQSSVTLYGIIDLGLQWNKMVVRTGTTAAPIFNQESAWSVDSGYQSGSRFGLRGSEALGRDWSAVFTLEGGFDGSTGASLQGGLLFGRQAWAGLSHKEFGTFVFGRVSTPTSGSGSFQLTGDISPFGITWGINSAGSTIIPLAGLREDNSFLWASPNWRGFKVAASWSTNVSGAESAPQGSNTSAYSIAANYTWGPLFVAAGYDVINYDFKVVKVYAAYADQSNISGFITAQGGPIQQVQVAAGVGNYDNQAYQLGLSAPLFGGSLLFSYQWSDAKNINTVKAQFEPDYNVWGIGYSYPFSRRTNMYIGYGQRSWDGKVTALGTATAAERAALQNASQIVDRDQFAVGIRHLF
jgi:GBP family porin